MNGEFRVALYGIQEKDRNVLKRILAITQGRARTYALLKNEANENTDIVIVNADNPKATSEWTKRYVGSNGISMCPTILASRKKISSDQYSTTTLPFFPTRILKCLDEVTVKDLKFTPEIRIDDDQEIPEESKDTGTYKTELTDQELETYIGKNTFIGKTQKRNVLVVDDSLPVRKALDMKLRLMDYEVHHAASGREAIWSLQKNKFDFIFLDVVMPGMDGYEVCKIIKRNKFTKNIPVVMLTSRSSPFDKVKGKLAGCDSYLTKPVEHDKFEKVVAGISV